MRLSIFLASVLLLMGAFTFSADLQAANALFPGGGERSEKTTEEMRPTSQQSASVWSRAAAWVWAKQREFHRALTRELRKLRGQSGVGWALVLMSFLYGVFHAAGPGHGKAALTTYLVTHPSQMNRAIVMGATAALLQGVTALLLVYGLIGIAGWLPGETQTASLWATRVSFALLAMVGLYLLFRAVIGVVDSVRRWRKPAVDHHHHHHSEHGESCGCQHMPSKAQIDQAHSRRAALGVVLAIGLRPCSGAVLVLILASVMGLGWHGAFAVLAMSLGTAITVVTLALLATQARAWASSLVAHQSPLWTLAGSGVGALGGALLSGMGFLLLSTSFSVKPALGL